MMIAGIVMVALAGVRRFTASAEGSFERSTTRFDRPGTYAGGEVDFSGDRGFTGDEGYFIPVSTQSQYAECRTFADEIVVGEFRAWREEHGTGDMSDWGYYWGYVRCEAEHERHDRWQRRTGRETSPPPACGPENSRLYEERGRNRAIRDCMEAVGAYDDAPPVDNSPSWSELLCAAAAFYLVHLPDYIGMSPYGPPTFPPGTPQPPPGGSGFPVFEYEEWAPYCR